MQLVVVKNDSNASCTIGGYPHLDFSAYPKADTIAIQAQATSIHWGAANGLVHHTTMPTFVLGPGHVASFWVKSSDIWTPGTNSTPVPPIQLGVLGANSSIALRLRYFLTASVVVAPIVPEALGNY